MIFLAPADGFLKSDIICSRTYSFTYSVLFYYLIIVNIFFMEAVFTGPLKFNKRAWRLIDDLQYSCYMKPVRDTNSEPGLPVLFQAVIVKDIYTRVT